MEASNKGWKEKIYIILGITFIIGVIVSMCVVVLVGNRNNSEEYIDYFRECRDNLLNEPSYIIINSVYNDFEEYIYLDSKVGAEMYSENQIEDTNNYELISWSLEDGTTYALQEEGSWIKYPNRFKELALASMSLDFDLWGEYIKNVEITESEKLNLGIDKGEVEVDMYSFSIPITEGKEVIEKKFDTLYHGIIEELDEKNKEGVYTEVINLYTEHINRLKDSYTFSSISGKIGIYDDKLAVFSVDILGGGDLVRYSKIVAYDTFKRREKPDFESETVIELSDFAYEEFLDSQQ